MEISENTKSMYRLRKVLKISILSLLFVLIGVLILEYIRIKPRDVYFTNVSSSSVTVSWNTKSPISASVIAFEGKSVLPIRLLCLGKERYYDTRDVRVAELEAAQQAGMDRDDLSLTMDNFQTEVKVEKRGKYYTHHVTVKGLEPETEYSFMVGDSVLFNKAIDKNNLNTISTLEELQAIKTPYPTYGNVRDAMNNEVPPFEELPIVSDGIVYLRFRNSLSDMQSNLHSSSLSDVGSWYIDMSGAINDIGENFLDLNSNDLENISAQFLIDLGPLGIWQKDVNATNISPVFPFIINEPESVFDEELSPTKVNSDTDFNYSSVQGVQAYDDSTDSEIRKYSKILIDNRVNQENNQSQTTYPTVANNDLCNLALGCYCSISKKTIYLGEYCNDGTRKNITSGTCTDIDGCVQDNINIEYGYSLLNSDVKGVTYAYNLAQVTQNCSNCNCTNLGTGWTRTACSGAGCQEQYSTCEPNPCIPTSEAYPVKCYKYTPVVTDYCTNCKCTNLGTGWTTTACSGAGCEEKSSTCEPSGCTPSGSAYPIKCYRYTAPTVTPNCLNCNCTNLGDGWSTVCPGDSTCTNKTSTCSPAPCIPNGTATPRTCYKVSYPTIPYIGNNTLCENASGCYCTAKYNQKIENNTYCTDNAKLRIPSTSSTTCADRDGCICDTGIKELDYSIGYGLTCESDSITISNNELCGSPAGCLCTQTQKIVPYKFYCTDGIKSTIPSGECTDKDGCICSGITPTEIAWQSSCATGATDIGNNVRCLNSGGCTCTETNNTLLYGQFCSDYVRTKISAGVCYDRDGCICSSGIEQLEVPIVYGSLCSNESISILNNRICKHIAGCYCSESGKNISYQSLCSDSIKTDIKFEEWCFDMDGCICERGYWKEGEGFDVSYNQGCFNTTMSSCDCPTLSSGEYPFLYCTSTNEYTCQSRYFTNCFQPTTCYKKILKGDNPGIQFVPLSATLAIQPGQLCPEAWQGVPIDNCLCTDDFGPIIEPSQYCTQTSYFNGWEECMDDAKEGDVCKRDGTTCIEQDGGMGIWLYCDGPKPNSSIINNYNNKLSSKNFVNKVLGQTNSNTTQNYIVDSQTGIFTSIQPGTYLLTHEGEIYSFQVFTSGDDSKTLIFIDKNDNQTYDEGIDINIGQNPSIINISPIELAYNYQFNQGFHFVSFPFLLQIENTPATASTLLTHLNKQTSDSILSISKYDGTWKVVGANNGQYDINDFQLIPGQGYILRTKRSISITLTGQPVQYESTSDNAPVTLFTGWNLIGLYGTGTKQYTAKSLIKDINAYKPINFTADNVSRWQSDVQMYDGYQLTVENGIDMEYGFDYPINTLQSYFVRIKEGKGNWKPSLAQ